VQEAQNDLNEDPSRTRRCYIGCCALFKRMCSCTCTMWTICFVLIAVASFLIYGALNTPGCPPCEAEDVDQLPDVFSYDATDFGPFEPRTRGTLQTCVIFVAVSFLSKHHLSSSHLGTHISKYEKGKRCLVTLNLITT
jgi:hypothetical protein